MTLSHSPALDPAALRQAVLDQIVAHPETHNQDSWQSYCGTEACVAGWAIRFAYPNQADIKQSLRLYSPDGGYSDFGQELLDLTPDQREHLFYSGEDQAVGILRSIIDGTWETPYEEGTVW